MFQFRPAGLASCLVGVENNDTSAVRIDFLADCATKIPGTARDGNDLLLKVIGPGLAPSLWPLVTGMPARLCHDTPVGVIEKSG